MRVLLFNNDINIYFNKRLNNYLKNIIINKEYINYYYDYFNYYKLNISLNLLNLFIFLLN